MSRAGLNQLTDALVLVLYLPKQIHFIQLMLHLNGIGRGLDLLSFPLLLKIPLLTAVLNLSVLPPFPLPAIFIIVFLYFIDYILYQGARNGELLRHALYSF